MDLEKIVKAKILKEINELRMEVVENLNKEVLEAWKRNIGVLNIIQLVEDLINKYA